MLNLAYGVLLGYPITVTRAIGAPTTPKYLMAAHVGALLQAAVLLGLVWAARLSALDPGWLDVATLAGRCRLRADRRERHPELGYRVTDEFGEKARTTPLAAPAETLGIGIFVAGVLAAL